MAARAEPAFSSPGTSAAEWPSRPSGITATCLSSCVPLPHPVHRRTPLAVVSCGAICHECHSSISSGCRTWSKLLWMPRSWLSIRGDPGLAVPKVGTHLAHLCVLRAEHRAWCPVVTTLVIVEGRTESLLHLEVLLLHIHSWARMPLQIRGLAKGSALWDCWVSQVWTCHGQNGQLRAASSGAAGQAVQTRGAGLGWVRESQEAGRGSRESRVV